MIILIIINLQEWLHLLLLAFDTVCPKRLLIKLDHYRIRGTAFKLMKSYLNYRLQYVCINNIESN